MNLLVIDKHDGEGVFPLFTEGTAVTDIQACKETPHWLSCVIDGHKTYIPDIYVADGLLAQDYDPTEMIAEKGQIVTLIAIVFEWLYVQDESGRKGWLPADKAISMD